MNPDQHVGHGHELKVGLLGVGEVHLRLPDGFDQKRVGQIQRRSGKVMISNVVMKKMNLMIFSLLTGYLRGIDEDLTTSDEGTCL